MHMVLSHLGGRGGDLFSQAIIIGYICAWNLGFHKYYELFSRIATQPNQATKPEWFG